MLKDTANNLIAVCVFGRPNIGGVAIGLEEIERLMRITPCGLWRKGLGAAVNDESRYYCYFFCEWGDADPWVERVGEYDCGDFREKRR